jgi:hypothetical protein
MRQTLIAILICLGLFSACSSDSPTSPVTMPIDVTGTWRGAITVQGVQARMTWTLTQSSGGAVSGPVLVGLSTGEVLLNGVLSGTLNGSTLAYTIAVNPGGVPTRPTCTGQLTGSMNVTIGPASTLVGPMGVSSSTCTPPFSGETITLTRQ